MIQIQGTQKLLSYEIKKNNKWKEKVESQYIKRSQIENIVVQATIKYNEHNKICNSWSAQLAIYYSKFVILS